MGKIGENIRELRERAGLTQEELGAAAGFDRTRVCKYETGRRVPKLPAISAIAKALGVPVADILEGKSSPGLSEFEKAALKKAVEEAAECGLLVGKYDAANGSEVFMHGVSTAMEYFAYKVSDEFGDAFSDAFVRNMVESEEREQKS